MTDEENPTTTKTQVAPAEPSGTSKTLIAFLGVSTVALLATTIVFALDDKNDSDTSTLQAQIKELEDQLETSACPEKIDYGPNPCQGKRPAWDNVPCYDMDSMFSTGPQSGANVTAGYQGDRNVTYLPLLGEYRDMGLCPVNVHWHLGTEHYSKGQYDENGKGPIEFHEGRIGFQCSYYDENDPKFTTPYNWEYCIGMTIGQTYEIHWPHSAAGMCNTPWQYQTPFYDGVFCTDGVLSLDTTHEQIGVESQTFVVVNSDAPEYQYADLFSGMIKDANAFPPKGVDVAKYTGSTTGTARNNQICSPFSPITWQVDRKCHIISAKSFDNMCRQMELQAANLKDDLYAHGSRELVKDEHAANNFQGRRNW